MKLEDLRKAFVAPEAPELETEGPKCTCCGRYARGLKDTRHGLVCMVCRDLCYDLLADQFRHGMQDLAYDPKQVCERCGFSRLCAPDHASGKWIPVGSCERCARATVNAVCAKCGRSLITPTALKVK